MSSAEAQQIIEHVIPKLLEWGVDAKTYEEFWSKSLLNKLELGMLLGSIPTKIYPKRNSTVAAWYVKTGEWKVEKIPSSPSPAATLHQALKARLTAKDQESNQMSNVPFQMIPTVFGKNAEKCSEQDLIDAAQKCDECIKAMVSLQGSSTKIDAKIESYKEQKAAILRILDARP